jgi:hypothetical protein
MLMIMRTAWGCKTALKSCWTRQCDSRIKNLVLSAMSKSAVKRPDALTGALRRCVRRLLMYRLPKSATVLPNEAKSDAKIVDGQR